MRFAMCFSLFTSVLITCCDTTTKRALQKSHEKPQWVKWSEQFLGKIQLDQQAYLVKMLKVITEDYLMECIPIILYDGFAEIDDNLLIEKLFRNFPTPYIHGKITENYTMVLTNPTNKWTSCVSYVLFMKDVMKCRDVIGEQSEQKIVVVARSSQWRVFEFLTNEVSRSFVNLLVIVKSETLGSLKETPYILYTHNLYIDALGTSKPVVLTSYQGGEFTRKVNLFPKKMSRGFAGHRFIVSVAHQPPFVISKGRNLENENSFDGIEIRLINTLAKLYNFTTDYREATEDLAIGSTEAVSKTIEKKKANLGIGGIYITQNKINRIGITQWHSQDCAAFISMASTALPRYRAIMGPFHWSVWLILTLIYLLAIFPLAFADKHTLKHLLKNPEEIENMFWYVFGTFTNCFTFTGRLSWNKSEKNTTRLLVGFYWLFTIIVTACYTGSIIAFITLPIFPPLIDTVNELSQGRFQIGTLDKGEWQYLFLNSSDRRSERLLKNLELVPNIEAGLNNVTKSFFWKYAFLASRAQLDYIVRTNFTSKSKRSGLHISAECFVPFNVAILYPKNSPYEEIFNTGIKLVVQAGLMNKIKSDVEWEMIRSPTGKLMAVSSTTGGLRALTIDDRSLTIDDTQGIFLLLGAGFLIGGGVLLSEIFGGCLNLCKLKRKKIGSAESIKSNSRVHVRQTKREILDLNDYFRNEMKRGPSKFRRNAEEQANSSSSSKRENVDVNKSAHIKREEIEHNAEILFHRTKD